MNRVRRRVLRICLAFLVAGALVCLAGGLWLTFWVPTKGKAWLETQLERQLPLDVTIGRMRYTVWEGLLLEDVRGIDPHTGILWLHAPHLQAHVGVATLVLQQQAAFRVEGAIAAPCQTNVAMAGRFQIRRRRLALDATTTAISLDRIIPQLVERLPRALKAGSVELTVHLDAQPDRDPSISGRLTGTRLVWEQGSVRLTTNINIDGAALPPAEKTTPWSADLRVRLDHGTMDGLPIITTATDVSGAIHVTPDTVEIQSLRGTAMGSPWELEGTITQLANPLAELKWHTDVNLETAATHLTSLKTLAPAVSDGLSRWQPRGRAELTVVVRGPLRRWPDLELMAAATLHEASCSIPQWPHPVEHLTGRLGYDHLARVVTIERIDGRVHDAPLTLQGSARLTTPPTVTLAVDATTDLGVVQEFLPRTSPIKTMAGAVVVHAQIDGTTTAPIWRGSTTISEGTLQLQALPRPVEHLTGTIRFTNDEITSDQLSFAIDQQPIHLTGSISGLTTAPRVVCDITLTNGSVSLRGQSQPEWFLIEDAAFALGESRLRLQGQVSRVAQRASQLTMRGTVDPSDLSRLPWWNVPAFTQWQVRGSTTVQLHVTGPLEDWRMVSARGILRANMLNVRELPVRDVTVELEQAQGHLTIRLLHALLAGGKLVGQYTSNHTAQPPQALVEADLTMADLAQMAAAIEAWRGRTITGSLSGHLSVLGSWSDRASLRGDGWLHATGEHLAELPLLDAVLRGFFGALADRLGLSTMRKAQITDIAGQWRLAQGRITTKDLRLSGLSGAEPITIYVRGSVGLDKTLDLTVEPELSEQVVLQAPNTSSLGATILKTVGGLERLRRLVGRHHLGGTLDKPEYRFEFSLDQLLRQMLPVGFGDLLESLR